jgi:hypothetical protein
MLIINKNKAPNKEEEKGARWKDSNPHKEDKSQDDQEQIKYLKPLVMRSILD